MTAPESDLAAELRSALSPGMTIALGDGVGQLRTSTGGEPFGAVLSSVARELGGIRLIVGWLPVPLPGIDPAAYREIIALMPGWGARPLLEHPNARFVPTRLSATPAVLSDVLRPQALLTRLVQRDDGLWFSTEVSWQRSLVEAGTTVLGIIDSAGPVADAGPPLGRDRVRVIGHTDDGPVELAPREPEPIHQALAEAVARFIPDGARLQYGPGQLGTALLSRLAKPVRIDTGLLTDAVVDLDKRGLLIDNPSATYLLGSKSLYDWADGRPILRGVDYTHDLTRLSRGTPLVAVNTAVEIDPWGQVNVEGPGSRVIGGIGGHPDYCAAAAMSRGGLSIVAVPSSGINGSGSLAVAQLTRPVSTPAYDVDLIVTEVGHADLRGADWLTRRALIADILDTKE